jgi:hypothetical protein
MKKNYLAIMLFAVIAISCKKENLSNSYSGNELVEFKTMEDYQQKLKEYQSLDFDELATKVEKENSVISEIIQLQKVLLDTNAFETKEDLLSFVSENSNYLKIIKENNEDELVTLYENNPNKFFANKNSKMFKIGNNVYKILNDGTVYTSVNNFNKLKNLNIQSVNDLNQDDIFVFQSLSEAQIENKTFNYYFNPADDRLDCGPGVRDIFKTGLSASGPQNRTRIYVNLRTQTFNKFVIKETKLPDGTKVDIEYPYERFFYVEFDVRNALRSWGVWIPARRTTSVNLSLNISTRINTSSWEETVYPRTINGLNTHIHSDIDVIDITTFGSFNFFINGYNISFNTPSIPTTRAICN